MAPRLCALVLLAAIIPACGHSHDDPVIAPGGGGGGPPPPPGGTITLLSDGFATFPGSNWSAATLAGGGAVGVDGANGDPAPSLVMSTSSRPGDALTRTQTAFATASLTVSVRVSSSFVNPGSARVNLFTSPAGPVIASAVWDSAAQSVAFDVNGTAATVALAVTAGTFHTFAFTVDGAGNASWSLDGGAATAGAAGFPNALALVELGANWPNAGGPNDIPVFRFDNVLVTSP